MPTRPHSVPVPPTAPARLALAAALLLGVAAACAGGGEDAPGWTLGPTLDLASPDSEGSAQPSEVNSPAVGSGAPVGSLGPDTSSAAEPSAP